MSMVSYSLSFHHLVWAVLMGGISALSLPVGAVVALVMKPKSNITGMLSAFGAGALIAALSIELVAPTVAAVTAESYGQGMTNQDALNDFGALLVGSVVGGILFVLLNEVVNAKGAFLRKSAFSIAYFTRQKRKREEELIRDLANVPTLRNVPADMVQELIACIRPIILEPGRTLFKQGDEGERLYIIQSGEIDLYENGTFFKTLTSGHILGEIALLTEGPRTATAKTRTQAHVLALTKTDFQRLREMSPALDQATRDLASSRMHELRERHIHQMQQAATWAREASQSIRNKTTLPTNEDYQQALKEHSGAPLAIWLGILLDGIPESFVIGTVFLSSMAVALQQANDAVTFVQVVPFTLIAGLFLSNFPEAMSSSAGMQRQGWRGRRILLMWVSLMVMTAIGAGVGYLVGGAMAHTVLVAVEGVAAGAMLTMIASTMLPEAVHLGGSNTVGISTLLGFLAAICFKLFE